MEPANLLMRYRGTDAVRAPASDEAVRLPAGGGRLINIVVRQD